MSHPHVEVSGLTISVGDNAIVEDVSFAIPRGEVLALIGESGSGKTTIALSLLGHTRFGARIAAGSIRLGDTRIDLLDDRGLATLRGRRVSYVAQSAAAAFNPSRPIMAQVIEPLLVHGMATRIAAESRAVALFRALSLPSPETIGRRYPHQVSGGQLQRLMAAMALITGPELVILDEPTTALDVTTQVDVLRAFKFALHEVGATAIYVSHDLPVVAQMANRIAVLNGGRVVEQGPTADLLAAPTADYTRTLFAAASPRAHGTLAPAGAPVLSVNAVAAGYGKVSNGVPAVPVLSDVSFTVARGGAIGIIGESGSGKSTLARVIAGLLPRAAGEVALAGDSLAPALAARPADQLRRVQLVFQNADTALNPAHTVGETLARPLALFHGLKGAAADARVAELMDLIRLPRALAARRCPELSGGQKQRVNLARALAAEPEVLLCDEVTSALDTVVGAAILQLIDELRRDLGIATVFISHDISTVRAFCDSVLVLYGGTTVEQATRPAFARGPHHPYTRLLLDSMPEMRRGWLEEVGLRGETIRAGAEGRCRFLPRCPVAIPGMCDRSVPPLRAGDGQAFLCHQDLAALTGMTKEPPA
jgi:peptide/nickel transport system ATP-binding protein